MAGCASTASARCGRPIGLPASRRAIERGVVELEAELAQAVGHRLDPARAVAAEVVEGRDQVGVGDVELVAEDVQVLVAAVHGGELGGGGEAHARARARGAAASGTPSTVSWSVSANSSTPAAAARSTTSAAGSDAVGVHGMGLQVE